MSAPDRTRDTNFELFDALRGLAACMVFVVHGAYQFAVTQPGEHAWYRFAIHGDVAVPIFFAISGFLLYRPFVSARVRGKPISVRAYAWRRFLRIVPAYWVALPVITLWLGFEEISSVATYLWYALFLQLYDPDTALKAVGQAWTLDIEVTYYAFLPLWIWALTRVTRPRDPKREIRAHVIGVLGLIGLAFTWQMATLALTDVANLESSSATLVRILPIQFDHLGAGMLLAVLSVWAAEKRRKGEPMTSRGVRFVEEHPWVVWAVAWAIWLIACYAGRDGGRSSYHYTDRQFFAEHVLYTPFVFLLLAPAVFGDQRRDRLRRFLTWRPLAYVGMVSYSFYLYHFAVLVQQARWWDAAGLSTVPDGVIQWAAWLGGAFLGTVLLATVSFYLIEKPFMSLKYRTRAARQVEAAQARAAP